MARKGFMSWAPYLGLFLGLIVVGYAYTAGYFDDYLGGNGGGILDLGNNTTENVTYTLGISDLNAQVLETGNVEVTFNLLNAEHFNITQVAVYYAKNVADPNNATFTQVNATAENGTYKAEIPATWNDQVYYYVEVAYKDGNETKTIRSPEAGFNSVTVADVFKPTINNVTVSYDANTTNVTFTVAAQDNDALKSVVLYYAFSNTTDFTNATFANITATVEPWTFTVAKADEYLAFYVTAEDLAGNVAELGNATAPFVVHVNATATWTFPESSGGGN